MTAWMVRAGKDGTEEETSLDHGAAVIGWDAVPDLTAAQTRDDLRSIYQKTLPESEPGTVTRDVTQLWCFRSEMQDGDIVVLPLKTNPAHVAVGRITGPYRYRADFPAHAHHTRPVEWIDRLVPRDAFGDDLRRSFNVPSTISAIRTPDAEARILSVLEGGAEPVTTNRDGRPPFDRQSEECARAVFDRLYPRPLQREAVLRLLAESVCHAHSVGVRCWEITLHPDGFRLNVGMVWAMSGKTGRKDALQMLLDGPNLDDADRDALARYGSPAVDDRGLKSLSQPLKVTFAGEAIDLLRDQAFFPALQRAHFQLIDTARTRRANVMWQKAHSPGILKYLRSALQIDVPDPEYSAEPPLLPATPGTNRERYVEPALPAIVQAIRAQGMRLDDATIRRYHVSLKTRGFVILSGLSGTGKTWLGTAYARAVSARCLVVPVAPNWTSNEDLLGYWSPLDSTYHDTELSRFLREASVEYAGSLAENRRPVPFHVVLDEMNLARVEYYFAKFLSALEERAREGTARVALAADDTVSLGPNLFFVGTVNVDETTHGFADKVYDRAQFVELTASRDALWLHIGDRPYQDVLMEFWDAVHEVAPFAFRIADEIAAYVDAMQVVDGTWREGLDEQILQKILPKLGRTDASIGEVLRRCREIAEAHDLPLTAAKVRSMEAGLARHGFASYF